MAFKFPRFWQHKKYWGLFTLCCLFLLALPIYKAHAQIAIGAIFITAIITAVISAGVNLALMTALIAAAVALTFTFSSMLLIFGNYILNWAISGPFGFKVVSFTNPASNQIIAIGWTLLRDFTNVLFVLGLAYIGLATALNFANFNTKKAFINLLLIALLINFTPVICGAIVDAANIVTKFFTSQVNFNRMVSVLGQDVFINTPALDFLHEATPWAKLTVMITYCFLGGLILFIFGLLFLLRHIAIWILVILSPLAFFAWIFDNTRKYFQAWWHQFILWSFIAVPASFFLYLAQAVVNMAGNNPLDGGLVKGGGIDPSNGFFTELAPYFVTMVFMAIGFYATKKFTPIGAKAIVGWANNLQKKGTDAAKKYSKALGVGALLATPGAMIGAGKAAQGAKASGQKFGGQIKAGLMGGFKNLGAEGRELTREKVGVGLEALHLRRIGTYQKGKAKRMQYGDVRKAIEDYSIEAKKKIAQRTINLTSTDVAERGLAIESLIKENDFDFGRDEAKEMIKFMQDNHKELKVGQLTKSRGDLADLIKNDAVLKEIKAGLDEETARHKVIRETVQKMNVENFEKNAQAEAYQSPVFLAGMDEPKIKHIATKGSQATRDALAKMVRSSKYLQAMHDATTRGDTETLNGLNEAKHWIQTHI